MLCGGATAEEGISSAPTQQQLASTALIIPVSPTQQKIASTALFAGKSYMKCTAEKVRDLATKGPLSFRVLAFLGGIAMVVSSLLDIVQQFLAFHPVNTLIALYTTVLGLIIVFLEGKEWACPVSFQRSIRHYAKFLEFTWGRGCLYFFAGSLQFTRWGIVNMLVGGLMCSVGMTAIIVGQSTAEKLNKLRASLKDKQALEDEFNKLDTKGDGCLSPNQLAILANNLGLDLERNELVAAVTVIDKNGNGNIAFEDFYLWWAGWDHSSDSLAV
mmetsp:Transcript_15606/g.23702  ORF Transcript_15606/g.23702 Transcript_15606/m.23702 type:complete len:272 (+) Transcript_15606:92-907(+)